MKTKQDWKDVLHSLLILSFFALAYFIGLYGGYFLSLS